MFKRKVITDNTKVFIKSYSNAFTSYHQLVKEKEANDYPYRYKLIDKSLIKELSRYVHDLDTLANICYEVVTNEDSTKVYSEGLKELLDD